MLAARADLFIAYTECKANGEGTPCEQIAESVAELDTELPVTRGTRPAGAVGLTTETNQALHTPSAGRP